MTSLEIAFRPAELVLVAGPNGSGKSTIAEDYIQRRFPIWPKLTADRLLIALEKERALTASPHPAIQAARIVDTTARCLAMLAEPFVLETVLSSDKYRPLVGTARRAGLIFRLVYVTTIHAEINVARVQQRVRAGGHDVPEDKIRDRWVSSMNNLPWFASQADRLVVVDNSGQRPRVIALRHLGGPIEIDNESERHPAGTRLRTLAGASVHPQDHHEPDR